MQEIEHCFKNNTRRDDASTVVDSIVGECQVIEPFLRPGISQSPSPRQILELDCPIRAISRIPNESGHKMLLTVGTNQKYLEVLSIDLETGNPTVSQFNPKI